MEAVAAQSFSHNLKPSKTRSTALSFSSPSFLQCRSAFLSPQSLRLNNLKLIRITQCSSRRNSVGFVHASVAQGWLLEPVGNGDWKHIGYKVAMPGAYEIFSSEMTVGRVPEKADLVIPVATVSGVHARIQNKEGSLFVTDIDSTNGTFINEKRVPPGATALVPPGSLITFGDTNLAIFRVSRFEKALETEDEPAEMADQSQGVEEIAQPETAS